VALDGAGRRIFLQLIASADVLLEAGPAGRLGQLGLGPEAAAQNPRLVHVALSPFGSDGPWARYRELLGWDQERVAEGMGDGLFAGGGRAVCPRSCRRPSARSPRSPRTTARFWAVARRFDVDSRWDWL
jgi:hypothetical protein